MILASVQTKAQNLELYTYLEEFVIENSLTSAAEISMFWMGMHRENPYSTSWNWFIGDEKKCPINKFGPRYFGEGLPNSSGGSVQNNCLYMQIHDSRYKAENSWLFGRCDVNLGNFGYVCQEKITCCNCNKPTTTLAPGRAHPREPNSAMPTYVQQTLIILSVLFI